MTSPTVRRSSSRNRYAAYRSGPLQKIGGVAVWLFALFCLAALAFMIMSSFKSSKAILESPWALPDTLHLENWAKAWNEGGLAVGFLNSVILVVGSAIATSIVAAPAAYVLSRRVGRFGNAVIIYFVLGLGIPLQIVVLPLYSIMVKLGLIDNLFGLFVLYVVFNMPFTVFLLTGFFGTLPAELEDAAAIDGLSANRAFWQIMLPLAQGGLLTSVILNAISAWNETFLSLMFIQSNQNFTLPLALLNYFSQQQFTGSDYGALFAAVSISVVPMVALYIWFGRRLTEGLVVGTGK